MLTLAISGTVLGVEAPNIVNDNDNPKYNLNGNVVISGTSDGAEIRGNSFDYTTTKSTFGFSFLGPNTNLAFTGAEDVDVNIVMKDSEDNIVDRYTETIQELPATDEQTVDFSFPRKEAGEYTLEFDINFECTFITYGCDNVDSFETTVEVPK